MNIDIGPNAIDRPASNSYGYTYIEMTNPANAPGKITSIEIWAKDALTGCKVGTFHGTAPNFTPRDVETIGNVAAGSKQTFSGLNIDVQSGDYIGIYWSNAAGNMEATNVASHYYKSGDQFSAGEQTYTQESYVLSVYGTGTTAKTTSQSFFLSFVFFLLNILGYN